MVAETLEPGASVLIVARRHDVNSNQLFRWRRQLLPKAVVESGAMVPVEIAPDEGGELSSNLARCGPSPLRGINLALTALAGA